ncbi:MAG: hypothetical protein K8R73_16575, partial [Clostridiales bacterium]|nr:hypothetical protein [Clostridiales bacterium]
MKSTIYTIAILVSVLVCSLYSDEQPVSFEEIGEYLENDPYLSEVLNNRAPMPLFRPRQQTVTYGYDMVIITNSTLQSKFEDFAEIKCREGVRTFVVTTTTTGSDSLSIREWLEDGIEGLNPTYPDLKYVILGGDETIIPTATMPFDLGTNDKSFSTDFYYANVLHDFPTITDQADFVDI